MKWLIILIISLLVPVKPINASIYPSPTGNISDFAGVLSETQKTSVEKRLADYRAKTGNEIAVAIVKDLGGDTIENYAVKMFEQWKIGQKGKDNGVLLLVAINDHKVRIEVGYGLEPYLTDAKSGDIIRNVITPKFKQNNYYGGVLDGVTAIENVLAGNDQPIAVTASKKFEFLLGSLGFLGWFIFPIIIYFCAFLGRSKAIWPGAVIGLILGAVFAGLVGAIIVGIIGLLLDWALSKNYDKLKAAGKKTGLLVID
ncbi:TPM domain-containing protein [Candidatus Microgenomates bacterium]|nr:TPM domain-containing protein [Candidatus Microgenomates bacterium]